MNNDQPQSPSVQTAAARVVVKNYKEVRRGGKLLFEIDGPNKLIRVGSRGKVQEVDISPYLDGRKG